MLFGGRSLQGPQAHLDCGFLYQASDFKQTSRTATQPHIKIIKELGSKSELPVRHVKGMVSGSKCKVLAARFQALGFAYEVKAIANIQTQPHAHHHEMQVG